MDGLRHETWVDFRLSSHDRIFKSWGMHDSLTYTHLHNPHGQPYMKPYSITY